MEVARQNRASRHPIWLLEVLVTIVGRLVCGFEWVFHCTSFFLPFVEFHTVHAKEAVSGTCRDIMIALQ